MNSKFKTQNSKLNLPFPLITVIIPTYNRFQFLLEAVESVEAQSYPNLEIIVVDDGSTDETSSLSKKDNLKYIFQENKGPSAARNTGAIAAKGDWLAFLDSDDLWTPKKLMKQWDALENNPDCKAVYTNEIWIRNGVRINQCKKHKKYSGWIYPQCLPLCIISPSSILLHKKMWEEVGGMDESLPMAEDYDLWLRLSAKHKFLFLDENLIIKRAGHSDQLSIKWGIDRYRVTALLKMLNSPELSDELKELTRLELLKKSKVLAIGFKRHGKNEEARFYEKICLSI